MGLYDESESVIGRRDASSTIASILENEPSTAARNNSFFVPNRRNRYGWLTPASRATSSVDVPWRPPDANALIAAWTMSARRSSADRRDRDAGAAVAPGVLVGLAGRGMGEG